MEDQYDSEISSTEVGSNEHNSQGSDEQSAKLTGYLGDEQKHYFSEIGKWASWSGILLYILTAMSVFGIYRTYSLLGGFGGVWILVIGIIIVLLYLFMALSAHKFGSNLKRSGVDDNPDSFYIASNHLLAFFQILGIPLMIIVVIYGLIICFAVIFGGLGSLMN